MKFSILFLILITSACSSEWIADDNKDKPLEGKRISVLALKSKMKVDPKEYDIIINVPHTKFNAEWSFQQIAPHQNPFIGENPTSIVSVDTGDSPQDGYRLTSTPIVGGGMVYTIDGAGNIEARKVENIEELLWKKNINSTGGKSFFGFKGGDDFLGGNIGYNDHTLFVTTGRGVILALNTKDGTEKWKNSVKIPIKSAPSVGSGKVFFITLDNRLYALDKKTGKVKWTHSGLKETTTLFGSPSPVVKDNTVIATYSSGEIYSLKAENGKILWSDILMGNNSRHGISDIAMNDINATPIVSDGSVYIASNDGLFSKFNLYDGKKSWTKSIQIIQTPWVAGDFIYLVTKDNEIVCLNAPDGRIKWIKKLPSNKEPTIKIFNRKGDKISWSSLVLARNHLMVVGSHGKFVFISPYTGKVENMIDIPENIHLPAIVANKTVFMLSNDAELVALR